MRKRESYCIVCGMEGGGEREKERKLLYSLWDGTRKRESYHIVCGMEGGGEGEKERKLFEASGHSSPPLHLQVSMAT